MDIKLITKVVLISSLLVFAGCSSRTKIDEVVTVNSVDSAGNPVQTVTKTNTIKAENVSVIESLAPIMKQCVGDIEAEDAENEKKTLIDVLPKPADCSKFSTAGGQSSCSNNNTHLAAYTILGLTLESATKEEVILESPQAFCARQVAAIAKGYHDKESAQAGAWKAVGLTTAIALPAAWVFTRGMDMIGGLAEGQGDNITTGDINMTKSDDPAGGEGGGGGNVNGSQVLNIGSGNTATDQGMTAENVDKAMHTNFKDAESNLDGSGSPSGVVLSDDADGSANELGLVTP